MHKRSPDSGPNEGSAPRDEVHLSNSAIEVLTDAVRRFAQRQLGLHPATLFVDAHTDSIVLTMHGFLAEAEKNGAKEKRVAALIARSHTEAFRTVRGMLELQASRIIGRPVEGSSLFLDPESDYGTIILFLEK